MCFPKESLDLSRSVTHYDSSGVVELVFHSLIECFRDMDISPSILMQWYESRAAAKQVWIRLFDEWYREARDHKPMDEKVVQEVNHWFRLPSWDESCGTDINSIFTSLELA